MTILMQLGVITYSFNAAKIKIISTDLTPPFLFKF